MVERPTANAADTRLNEINLEKLEKQLHSVGNLEWMSA